MNTGAIIPYDIMLETRLSAAYPNTYLKETPPPNLHLLIVEEIFFAGHKLERRFFFMLCLVHCADNRRR